MNLNAGDRNWSNSGRLQCVPQHSERFFVKAHLQGIILILRCRFYAGVCHHEVILYRSLLCVLSKIPVEYSSSVSWLNTIFTQEIISFMLWLFACVGTFASNQCLVSLFFCLQICTVCHDIESMDFIQTGTVKLKIVSGTTWWDF